MTYLKKYFEKNGENVELLEMLIQAESKERLEELAEKALQENKTIVAVESLEDFDRIDVKLI